CEECNDEVTYNVAKIKTKIKQTLKAKFFYLDCFGQVLTMTIFLISIFTIFQYFYNFSPNSLIFFKNYPI
ncbi:MAG: hypothetical protein K2G68_01840, partial [Helicobacter sp.]|nr:hypothetical protein [Helicobacter sp.]